MSLSVGTGTSRGGSAEERFLAKEHPERPRNPSSALLQVKKPALSRGGEDPQVRSTFVFQQQSSSVRWCPLGKGQETRGRGFGDV